MDWDPEGWNIQFQGSSPPHTAYAGPLLAQAPRVVHPPSWPVVSDASSRQLWLEVCYSNREAPGRLCRGDTDCNPRLCAFFTWRGTKAHPKHLSCARTKSRTSAGCSLSPGTPRCLVSAEDSQAPPAARQKWMRKGQGAGQQATRVKAGPGRGDEAGTAPRNLGSVQNRAPPPGPEAPQSLSQPSPSLSPMWWTGTWVSTLYFCGRNQLS